MLPCSKARTPCCFTTTNGGDFTIDHDGLLARGRSAPPDEIYCQNYRYFEALIRPGDRVTVEGFASVAVHPAGERAGLRAPPLLYALSGTPERPAIVSVPEPGSVAP